MASPGTPPSLPLVIVGGGIQGLCLLRRAVDAGIDAVLFTKGAVGDGETLHSHALMSGGSWASTPAAATTCAASISALRKLVPAHCFYDQATFMFIVDKVGPVASPMDEAAMTKAWAAFNISNKPMAESAVPALFRGDGPIKGKALYQSAVDGLYNDVAVVKALYEPLKDRVRRGELVNITLNESGKGLSSAAFKLPDGQVLTVRPTQLLLATGAWTVPIVHKTLTGAAPSVLSALQAQVTGRGLLMPMIIIRGKELPRVAGFAMSSGIIWGYSETDDGIPEWRCTPTSALKVGPAPYGPAFDHTHPACPLAEVRNTVRLLETLIPGFGGIKTSLRYAYYADYRTEHPTSHDRPPLPTVLVLNSSLRVVLPGLWQHATTTAQTVISDLQKVPSFTSHVQSVHTVAAAPVATVAPRKVDTLTFMSYEELAQKLAAL